MESGRISSDAQMPIPMRPILKKIRTNLGNSISKYNF